MLSGVTILLSLTVFSQVVTDSMPRTSDANPLLGKTILGIPQLYSVNTDYVLDYYTNGCTVN